MKNKQTGAIHPLVAGAAASVMLVSLVGTAAITGMLPTSRGAIAPAAPLAAAPAAQASVAPSPSGDTLAASTRVASIAAEPPVQTRTVVHHRYVTHVQQVAQATPPRPHSQPAVQQQAPQPQYHPVGIGVGAVVGGLLGNQVGGGNGRTLATIAGAIGGGYVGNEVAKRGVQ